MRWEYKSVEWLGLMRFAHNEYERNRILNRLGGEEWELIAIHEGYVTFKRPARNEPEETKVLE